MVKFILTATDLHISSMFVCACACVCVCVLDVNEETISFLWCNSPTWASAASERVISWSQRPLPNNTQQLQGVSLPTKPGSSLIILLQTHSDTYRHNFTTDTFRHLQT